MTALGFHYFPDTLHYRQADLDTWLPELTALGANWLVLQAEPDRAIPEWFIQGLLQNHVTPIIQMQTSLAALPNPFELRPLLEAYANWGVQYIQYFNQPNQHTAWPVSGWVQQNLVERFLDIWLPYAHLSANAGLTPVFSPLFPGGSYWDTAFLRSALKSMQRRKANLILDKLVLSAYGWTDGRALDWGLGGAHAWPGAHPYQIDETTQDQRGFRIADWYLAIAEEEIKHTPGLFLYQAGLPASPAALTASPVDANVYHPDLLAVARLACGEEVTLPGTETALDPLPEDVTACCMWLLTADNSSPYASQGWYQADGTPGILAESWKNHINQQKQPVAKSFLGTQVGSIEHYLLLPTFEWGVADWHLELIRPYIKRYRPTVGFSIQEAAMAKRVTVIGNEAAFPQETLQALRSSGCVVEQISESGMDFATLQSQRGEA